MFKYCTNITKVNVITFTRVYTLDDFSMNVLIGCIKQQESNNPYVALLVLECGKVQFITETNAVCTKEIGIFIDNMLH